MTLRGPVGVFLAGGGALGAWQAGVIRRLFVREGLPADSLMGFSAGALNAAMLFAGRAADLPEAWESLGPGSVLKPSLRLRPLSVFSLEPLRAILGRWLDEDRLRSEGRGVLRVVSADLDAREPVVGVFSRERWDGSLTDHLLASSAIPLVFPPVAVQVDGRTARLVDGGVRTRSPIPVAELGAVGCVLSLSMIREEELGRKAWSPVGWYDQKGREITLWHVQAGLEALRALPGAPAVYDLRPSVRIPQSMLGFEAEASRRTLALGERDAEAFLRDPEAFMTGRRDPVQG